MFQSRGSRSTAKLQMEFFSKYIVSFLFIEEYALLRIVVSYWIFVYSYKKSILCHSLLLLWIHTCLLFACTFNISCFLLQLQVKSKAWIDKLIIRYKQIFWLLYKNRVRYIVKYIVALGLNFYGNYKRWTCLFENLEVSGQREK